MRLKKKLYPLIELMFAFIAETAENARQYFAICTACGANRYTGKPCIRM